MSTSRRSNTFTLVGAIVAVVAIIVPLVWLVSMPRPNAVPTVEIHDQANAVEETALLNRLQSIRFWQPTRVAILTLPDLNGLTLNDAVLEFGRSNVPDPSWINSQDQNYWADGLFVLAVAPKERLVGTYFGEDIAPPLEVQAEIQEATKDYFREGDWAGGLTAGTEAAAGTIGASPWRSTLVILGMSAAAICGVAWCIALFMRRRNTLSAIASARAAYANVTRDYEATEVTAGTIPDSGRFSRAIDERFRIFQNNYADLTRLFNDFGVPAGLALFNPTVRDAARELQFQAEVLDATDDSIVNAANFLGMNGDWRASWSTEQGPILEDLQSLETLIDEIPSEVRSSHPDLITNIRETSHSINRELENLSHGLEEGTITPENALDQLDTFATRIHAVADPLIAAALSYGDPDTSKDQQRAWQETDWSEQAGYLGYWSYGGRSDTYSPGSTIRPNSNTLGWDGAASSRTVPVSSLVVGYTAAFSAANSASASTTGSSTSYSGGFSGSGSSSSF